MRILNNHEITKTADGFMLTVLRVHSHYPANDNGVAKVLEFKPPPPPVPVYVVMRLPQAVKDSLCRETGYMDSVTDPVELRQAHDRFRSKVESIAAEAVTRYVHTRRQEELE